MNKLLLFLCAVPALLALAACGGESEEPPAAPTTTSVAAGGCGEIEELEVAAAGKHFDREFTAADFETNPPAGGDHSDTPLEAGTFYQQPAPLGEAVHLLEHGAVIGWTNGLSAEELKAVEEEFNSAFQEGYYQLATVENPEMDVPFALSAWGAVQACGEVDTAAIKPFIEEWYASPKSGEALLACDGAARSLPPC